MSKNGKNPTVPSLKIELPNPGDRVRLKEGKGGTGIVVTFNPYNCMATIDWGIIDIKIGRIITDRPIEDFEITERKEEAEKRIAEMEARLKAEGRAGQG